MARFRAAAACLVFVAFALFAAPPAWAQFGERYALVIGNSDYAHVEGLPNTARDAEAMADALQALHFTVFKGIDLTGDEFERLIDEFDQAAADADTVLFYFAGHGFQLNGLNYLAPVDAVLRDRSQIDAETFVLNDVIARIHRRQRQTIVFLDACRNNPLPPGARDGNGAGLAQVGTGDGTFIAFATQPGNVSYDGTSKNSPFTEALLTHIGKPGRNISSLMIEVRNDVSDRTVGRQVPWDQSSLREDFYFNPTPDYLTASAPARGGIVIGRVAAAADTEPAPRPVSPISIGPAPVPDPVTPQANESRPETLTAAVGARAQADSQSAPAARAQPDKVAAAASVRAMVSTNGASANRASANRASATVRALPDTATVAEGVRTRPDAASARAEPDTTAASAQPQAVTPTARFASVERLAPAREWFPEDEAADAEEQQVAALDTGEPLEPEPAEEPLIDERELARSIQSDLARLGCYRMGVDGVWGPGSRRSLEQFYREKGEAASSLEPSTDVLERLQGESGTVCAPPKTPKKPRVAAPTQKKSPAQKAPARAKAPQAPSAAPKTPKIIGF